MLWYDSFVRYILLEICCYSLQVIECLRTKQKDLTPNCHKLMFKREVSKHLTVWGLHITKFWLNNLPWCMIQWQQSFILKLLVALNLFQKAEAQNPDTDYLLMTKCKKMIKVRLETLRYWDAQYAVVARWEPVCFPFRWIIIFSMVWSAMDWGRTT